MKAISSICGATSESLICPYGNTASAKRKEVSHKRTRKGTYTLFETFKNEICKSSPLELFRSNLWDKLYVEFRHLCEAPPDPIARQLLDLKADCPFEMLDDRR